METNLTEVDLDALKRSVEVYSRTPAGRRRVAERLAAGEEWLKVARVCAFNCQIDSMHLQPWESTLVYADTREAHALVRRLKAAGLSRYEPDPLQAIAEAEQQP